MVSVVRDAKENREKKWPREILEGKRARHVPFPRGVYDVKHDSGKSSRDKQGKQNKGEANLSNLVGNSVYILTAWITNRLIGQN